MVNLDSPQSLDELCPELRTHLKLMQAEAMAWVLSRTTTGYAEYLDRIVRIIAIQSQVRNISVFAAAARVMGSEMIEVPGILAFAAALEASARKIDDGQTQT